VSCGERETRPPNTSGEESPHSTPNSQMEIAGTMSHPRFAHLCLALCALCLGGSTLLGADTTNKPPRITYDDHVLPLFKDKCVSCHTPDKKRGGLVLSNYTRLMEGGSSGACVKPGDPEGSLLYKVMAHLEEPFMPPRSPKLAKTSLDIVHKWIAGG